MAQKNRGLLWGVIVLLLLLLLAWLGSQYGWWSGMGGKNTGGTNYGTSPSPSSRTSGNLNEFYSNTRTGESKQQVSSDSQSKGLSQSCTLTVNTTQLKQEVCVYKSASASGSVTVTYQNDKVTAVAKAGF